MASGLNSVKIARIQIVLENKRNELKELVDNCDDATKLDKLQRELEQAEKAMCDFASLEW